MSGKYFYKGVDIYNLITPGDVDPSNSTSFIGFPKCDISRFNNNFESVGTIDSGGFINMYQNSVTGKPIGTPNTLTHIVATYIDYTFDSTKPLNENTIYTISPNNNPVNFTFNHISAFCHGGGGGGGGAGGSGNTVGGFRLGKSGGQGGYGAYGAVEKIPVNGETITLDIGRGGLGGSGGRNVFLTLSNGGNGGNGGTGVETKLTIGSTVNITANPGTGGQGGPGGGTLGQGSVGGSNGFSTVNGGISNYGGGIVATVNMFNLPNKWKIWGDGGIGANASSTNFTILPREPSGSPGTPGGCRIYFLLL